MGKTLVGAKGWVWSCFGRPGDARETDLDGVGDARGVCCFVCGIHYLWCSLSGMCWDREWDQVVASGVVPFRMIWVLSSKDGH